MDGLISRERVCVCVCVCECVCVCVCVCVRAHARARNFSLISLGIPLSLCPQMRHDTEETGIDFTPLAVRNDALKVPGYSPENELLHCYHPLSFISFFLFFFFSCGGV